MGFKSWLISQLTKSGKFNDIIIPTGGNSALTYANTTPANFHKNMTAYNSEVWVYACVYFIATSISGLKYKFYKKKYVKGVEEREYVDNIQLRALFDKPNAVDENSIYSNLIEWTCACLELIGNAYWLLDELYGPNEAKVGSIKMLMPDKVSIVLETDKKAKNLIRGYKYTEYGKETVFTAGEVTHFKYINPADYFYGQGAVSPSAPAIDLIREAQRSNVNFFRNGAITSGTLETDKSVTDKKYDQLKHEFRDKYTGAANAHKIIILDNGLKYKTITSSMKDLEFIEGIKLSREDICAAFGVPPVLVGDLTRATYSNYGEAVKIVWIHTIIPKLIRIEQVISTICQRFDPSIWFEFDISNVEALKEDQERQARITKMYFDMGVPFNVIKESLKLPFPDIEGGDIGYLPFSLAPAGSVANPPDITPTDNTDEEETTPKNQKSINWQERKGHLSKLFNRYLVALENKYKQIIAAHFKGLENRELDIIRNAKSIHSIDPITNKYTISYVAKSINDYLFDKDAEIEKWMRQSKKYHKVVYGVNGKRALTEVGSNISFDLLNPRATEYITRYVGKVSKEVIETVREDIAAQLAQGFESGESIPDLSKRIKTVFEGYTEQGYKADRIARTEVIASSNAGALEGYKQSGLKLGKGWLAAMDERTRETHARAGEVYSESNPIGLDEMFEVGGAKTDAPGNTGIPEEDIQCRCSIFATRIED